MSYIEYIKVTDLLLKIYEVNRDSTFGLRLRILFGGSRHSRPIAMNNNIVRSNKSSLHSTR